MSNNSSATPTVAFETTQLPFGQQQVNPNEVHLWLLDMQQLPLPTVGESADQKRFMKRFYLRLLLAAYMGRPAHAVKLAKTASGKPYIDDQQGPGADPPLFFSISHHEHYQLIAICSQHPVGVDLESQMRHLRQPMKLAKRYFHASEYAYLKNLPDNQLNENWLTIWTCKEAVVKATGGGIVSGLDRFAVLPGTDQPHLTAAINTPTDDLLHTLKLTQLYPCDDMLGALACSRDITQVRGWHLTHPGAN